MALDRHTYTNKRRVGSTDIGDFTDYQGIGHDPLYKRYESVNSIVKHSVPSAYSHFLAIPDYSPEEDSINWYIDEWNEIPQRLTSLTGEKRNNYERIKSETVSQYKNALSSLSGEELQIMACALRYIDDDFIYCCDNKVFVLAWGMTPDTNKHVVRGELIQESPQIAKHTVTFDGGDHGELTAKEGRRIVVPNGSTIGANELPVVTPDKGYEFDGWAPNPIDRPITADTTFVATYKKASSSVPDAPPPLSEDAPMAECRFVIDDNGRLTGKSVVLKPLNTVLTKDEIPEVTPNKGYKFKGWNPTPDNYVVSGDTEFHGVLEKKAPWYKRIFAWFGDRNWLRWLIMLLFLLFLIVAAWWLLSKCERDKRVDEINGVAPVEKITPENGEPIDNNGSVQPIELDDGKLPDDSAITPPMYEDGKPIPVVTDPDTPGNPKIAGNRLVLFLEDDNGDLDALAADFKKAYPGDQYRIIGFDKEVKSLVIQVPEKERTQIRQTINEKIPSQKFIVFDEQIYEITQQNNKPLSNGSGWHLNAIHAQEGWKITKGSPAIVIAVVDDGIDASHPIFKDRIVDAYNVFTRNNKLSVGMGHGTHTAGLAAGSLEFLNRGAAGIAPDCKLMPIQVLDNNQCPLSALVSGIMYGVHKGADVINVSIGPSIQGISALPIPQQEEIARTQFKNVEQLWQRVCNLASKKNTILVFAAGNDEILSNILPENRTDFAITVGAVDKDLCSASFSNFGAGTDISAPGKDIYSSFPRGNFQNSDGTSMSAPIVSGTIGLMKTLKKDLTVEQARNVLYRTGADVYGDMPPMVLVDKALDAVKRGDFSAPQPRPVRPYPGSTPSPGNDNSGSPLPGGKNSPGNGSSNPGGAVIGNIGIVVPNPGKTKNPAQTDPDYNEIRRQIKMHQDQIKELEKLLPENQKK